VSLPVEVLRRHLFWFQTILRGSQVNTQKKVSSRAKSEEKRQKVGKRRGGDPEKDGPKRGLDEERTSETQGAADADGGGGAMKFMEKLEGGERIVVELGNTGGESDGDVFLR